MTVTPDTASLAILRCPKCNAPVPLGAGENTVCLYCHTELPIPERHRALRDAERRTAEERAEASALYDTLGRPPGLVARLWGDVATGFVWLIFWPIAFVVDALSILKALDAISRSTHVTILDVLSQKEVWAIYAVALYATLAVPLVLGVYGRRRTNARRRLQAALAALPPDRAGGPARCHSCGAPLDVGPRDVGLQCVYCGADNLVRMPEPWVAKLRDSAKRLDARITTIAAADREMRREERKRVRRQLAWLFVFVPVFVGFGAVLDRDASTFPPSWRAAMKKEPRELVGRDFANRDAVPYELGAIPANGRIGFTAFERGEWREDHYSRSYVVPLRYGETVHFVSGDFPDGARAMGFDFRTQNDAIFGDDWRSVGKLLLLYPNAHADFVAPRSAWYRVDVLVVDDVPARQQFRLGVSIEPPK